VLGLEASVEEEEKALYTELKSVVRQETGRTTDAEQCSALRSARIVAGWRGEANVKPCQTQKDKK